MHASEEGKAHVFLGNDKLKTNVGMKILRRGEESYVALLDAGINWFEAEKTLEFYLQDGKSVELILTSLIGGGSKTATITLEELKGDVSLLNKIAEIKGGTLTAAETTAETTALSAIEPAEKLTEYIPRIMKSALTAAETAALTAPLEKVGTELVVISAFFRITQNFISNRDFFELLLCLFVPRIPVRMILDRKFPVRFLDLLIRCGFGNAKGCIIIFVCHISPVLPEPAYSLPASSGFPELTTTIAGFNRRDPAL